jgi:hypothetical protein
MINNDNKGAIGEAGQEGVCIIEEILGILSKMKH